MLSGTMDIQINTQVEGYINHCFKINIRWYITNLIRINLYSFKVKQFDFGFDNKRHIHILYELAYTIYCKDTHARYDGFAFYDH